MSDRKRYRYAALDVLYAELPSITCKGRCGQPANTCCGVIVMSALEYQRIEERVGKAAMQPRKDCPDLCPLLTDDGRCSVYDIRPWICRAWGVLDDLRCEFGCKPVGGYKKSIAGKAACRRSFKIGGTQRMLGVRPAIQ